MPIKSAGEKKRKRNRDKLKKEAEERKRRDLKEWSRLNPHLVESESEKQWRKQRDKQRLKKKPTIRRKRKREKAEWEVYERDVHDVPLEAPLSKVIDDPRNKNNKKSRYSLMGFEFYKGKN